MGTLVQDLRYGVRMLRRNPGFTAVVVLTLALGTGVNTAIFSVVKAVLLNALPYRHPERLVSLAASDIDSRNPVNVSYGEVQDWKERSHSFESIAPYRGWAPTLTGHGKPNVLRGMRVSYNFFETLGVQPLVGRNFLAQEDRPDRWRVVILSHGFWQQWFAGSPNAVGQTLTLDHEPFEIVGVLPANFQPLLFTFWSQAPEIWSPLGYDLSLPYACRGCQHLQSVARLKDGVTLAQARSEMGAIATHLSREFPEDYPPDASVLVTPLRDRVVGRIRTALWLLLGAAGCVLVIGCVNTANLLLSRATSRRREVGLRITLGASRARIVRQLLTESMLLSLVGGAAGVLLAVWGTSLLTGWGPADIPRLKDTAVDTSVLLFAVGVSVVTGVVIGMMPALQTIRVDQRQALQEGSRGTVGAETRRLRSLLVVSEVALAFVLTVATGLLLRSLVRALEVNPGFDPHYLFVADFGLVGPEYRSDAAVVRFEREAVERIRNLPGVEAAGIVSTLPMGGGWDRRTIQIQDRPLPNPTQAPSVDTYFVSPDYFRAVGIPLKRGRLFTDSDVAPSAAPAALISESTARAMWPHEDPLGKGIQFGPRDEKHPWVTIVGIVGDVRQYGLDSPATPGVYFLYTQEPSSFPTLVVRSSIGPAALRRAVQDQIWALDKDVPVAYPQTMEQLLSRSLTQRRFTMEMLGVFGLLALLLSAIGIYGVMGYSVTQRTNEIGIRMALGAEPSQILRLFAGEGMWLATLGIGVGLGIAWVSTRFMRTLLFGVGADDPVTYAGVVVIVLGVALLASVLPARRAARVDPMEALRYE